MRRSAPTAAAVALWSTLAAAFAVLPGNVHGQTVQLPPPAASSLDRIAQAPTGSYNLGPPPPAWDPYASQANQFPPSLPAAPTTMPSALGGQPGYPGYSTTAPSLMPPQQSPFQQPPPFQPPITPTQGTAGNPAVFPPGYPSQNSSFQQTMHLYQGARGSWAYLFGSNSGNQLGVNELDTTATFAVPFFMNSQANLNHAPLLVTPGFGLQLWDGPNTATTGNDLPPSTYDVFLDTAWNPQFTPLFGAELGLRVGVFTNWDVFVTDSWRIMGRAIGTLNLTPTMQAKAGIIYLDRNQVKLLPAVGMTWTPNADSRYDIFFPAPRATRRIANWRNRSIWGYVAGEYGGGAWTFRHSDAEGGAITPFDYNDIRVTVGAEMIPQTQVGLSGLFEVGYVFYRQLFYVNGPPQIVDLDSTLMLRFGLAY